MNKRMISFILGTLLILEAVILLLPEEFFRNCALLILALLMLWCAVLIFADLWAGKRRKQRGLDR